MNWFCFFLATISQRFGNTFPKLLCSSLAVWGLWHCCRHGRCAAQGIIPALAPYCPICADQGALLPDLIPLLHLPPKCINAPASHDCSSCEVFFKPLCNLSFAGSTDKAFCCLFFDPSARCGRHFQTSPNPEVFICKAEPVGDRRQMPPNTLRIDVLQRYNTLLILAFI